MFAATQRGCHRGNDYNTHGVHAADQLCTRGSLNLDSTHPRPCIIINKFPAWRRRSVRRLFVECCGAKSWRGMRKILPPRAVFRQNFPAKVSDWNWRGLCIMHARRASNTECGQQGISSLKSEWINTARYHWKLKATNCLCYAFLPSLSCFP